MRQSCSFPTAVDAAVAYAKDVEADGAGSSSAARGGPPSRPIRRRRCRHRRKKPPATPKPAATQLVPRPGGGAGIGDRRLRPPLPPETTFKSVSLPLSSRRMRARR